MCVRMFLAVPSAEEAAAGTLPLALGLFGLGLLSNSELSGWSHALTYRASSTSGVSSCGGGCG
jgi:hypothetical protein